MNIIFFDGLCPMCHAWVKRIIRWDKKKIFHFAPLESTWAETMLKPSFPEYLREDTLVYVHNGHVKTRSAAVLCILGALGFPYQLFGIGWLIPARIRDAVYRAVAKRRYRYGKRYEECPVPPNEWKDRFL